MIPTVEQILTTARGHAGDTAVPGGQIFKDDWLISNQHWSNAYDALFRWLDRNSFRGLRRTVYFNLPANTSYATPAGLGIANMGKPLAIYERTVALTFTGTIAAINAAGVGTLPSVDLTIPGNGMLTGQQVVTFGFGQTADTVTDDINGQWTITVLDPNTVRLSGCAPVDLGSAVGSTGIVSTGNNDWPATPMNQVYDLQGQQIKVSSGQICVWEWASGAFYFVPASQIRQLKIVFSLSGSAPSSGSVGIDDSRDALGLFVAASAVQSKNGPGPKAQALWMRAIGNGTGDTLHIVGGAFSELASLGLQEINGTVTRSPRYRPKRNVGAYPWGGIGY